MKQEQTPQINEAEMTSVAHGIATGRPTEIEIGGKKWKLRRISNAQAAKISEYAKEAQIIQEQQKREDLSKRKRLRLDKRFRQIPAKIAARYVLGLRRCWIPFATALTWRRLWYASEEVSMSINISKTLQREEESFFTANLEVVSYLLALSMKQVGEGARQWLERKESAENMLDEDALPKKEADSK